MKVYTKDEFDNIFKAMIIAKTDIIQSARGTSNSDLMAYTYVLSHELATMIELFSCQEKEDSNRLSVIDEQICYLREDIESIRERRRIHDTQSN